MHDGIFAITRASKAKAIQTALIEALPNEMLLYQEKNEIFIIPRFKMVLMDHEGDS